MSKSYELGIIVGRFQILHKGHSQIIRRGFEECERVGLLIGSSQESGTYKNPYTYEFRRELLLAAFPDLEIYALPDIGVGNNSIWGDYVLKNVLADFSRLPDLFISGSEDRREAWFGEETHELYVPKTIDISATKMKEYLMEGNREKWNEFIEPAIADRFDEMRALMLAAKDNTDTVSM